MSDARFLIWNCEITTLGAMAQMGNRHKGKIRKQPLNPQIYWINGTSESLLKKSTIYQSALPSRISSSIFINFVNSRGKLSN